MKSTKFITLLLAIFAIAAYAQSQLVPNTDWYNDSQNEFTITTKEELAGLASLVNENKSFSGKTVNLGANININGTSGWQNWDTDPPNIIWTPIGSSPSYAFEGTFNGKGYVIGGLYASSDYAAALFGYFAGTVKNLGIESSYLIANTYAGGLIGYNQSSGTVINCYSRAYVKGGTSVGGLVGNNLGSISYSYSAGKVTGTLSGYGGLVGENSGSVSSSYYDKTVSTQTDSDKGTPKTTSEMKQQSTFVGWDFSAIWGINSSKNSGYPYLLGSSGSPSSSSSVPSGGSSSSSIVPDTFPFIETFENGQNGWVFVNGDQPNKWMIGSATAYNGSYSAYISNNNSDNSYTTNSASIVHLYKDITFPCEESKTYMLQYYVKVVGGGGVGDNGWDYISSRYTTDLSSPPVAGSKFTRGTKFGDHFREEDWKYFRFSTVFSALRCQTVRFIFTWINDEYEYHGEPPPVAIDNICIYASGNSVFGDEVCKPPNTPSSSSATPSSSSNEPSSSSTTPSSNSNNLSSSSTETSPSSSSSGDITPIRLSRIATGNIRIQAIGKTIVLENLPSNAKVEVYNLQGNRIYSAYPENPQILKIGVQTKGMYIIKLKFGNQSSQHFLLASP